jgi:AraC family transcriptional regulator
MEARIEILSEKKLIGKHLTMTFANNKTFELWKSFMPRRKEIVNNLNRELISMQLYDTSFDFSNFDLHAKFEKWAAVEVSDFDTVPNGMERYILISGLYAVFVHKGAASTGSKTFRYIFETWLPNSSYTMDHRPHFEILGDKYKNEDPDSEEEIWIPIKPKRE